MMPFMVGEIGSASKQDGQYRREFEEKGLQTSAHWTSSVHRMRTAPGGPANGDVCLLRALRGGSSRVPAHLPPWGTSREVRPQHSRQRHWGTQTSSYLRSPHPHPSNQSSKVYQVRDPDINNNDYLFLCWTLFWKITKGKEPRELKKTKNKQWYFQDFMRNITQDLIL